MTQEDLRLGTKRTFREQNCVQKCPLGSKISSQKQNNRDVREGYKERERTRKKSEWGLGVDRFRAVELGREKVDECHVINLACWLGRAPRVTTYILL